MSEFVITLLYKLAWATIALSLASLALDYLAKSLNAKSYSLMAISGFTPLIVGVIVLYGSWQVTIPLNVVSSNLSLLTKMRVPDAEPHRSGNQQFTASEHSLRSDSLVNESTVAESTWASETRQARAIPAMAIAAAVLVSIWLAGVMWKIGTAIASYTRLCLLSREEFTVAENHFQAEWFLLQSKNRSSPIPLFESSVLGPALCLMPCGYSLVVPRSSWSQALKCERELVMRHELSHYNRNHILFIALCRALAAIHWFNPFAKACVARFELACEWQADDDAMNKCEESAVQLAKSLVYFNSPQVSISGFRGAAELSSNDSQLKKRVSRLFSTHFEKEAGMVKIFLMSFAILPMLALVTAKFNVDAAGSLPDDDSLFTISSGGKIDPAERESNNGEASDPAPAAPTPVILTEAAQDDSAKISERGRKNPYRILFDEMASRPNSPSLSKEFLQKTFRKDFAQLSNRSEIQAKSLRSIVRTENGDRVTYEFDVDPFLLFHEICYFFTGDMSTADGVFEGIHEDPQGPRIDLRKILKEDLKPRAKLICRFVDDSRVDWLVEIGLVDQASFLPKFRQYCKSEPRGVEPQTPDYSHVVFQPSKDAIVDKPWAVAVNEQRFYSGTVELVEEAIKP
jgi:beta-lactamase regulating signal transducer with metallopeptidase domain